MTGRSLWAWGQEDRRPDPALLAGPLAAVLGVALPAARAAAEPRIPAPKIACPLGFATQLPLERALRARGKAWPDLFHGFHGDFSTAPDVVLRPTREDEVAAALEWAAGAKVAIVPFGGGTSVVGGVECGGEGFEGVACLDLRGLGQVVEVDTVSRAARIQAGATGPSLERQLAAHGLTLRHFPQSFEFSTLGGWIATRAGGHFATGYTHIDDLVESVRMITPAGAWETRRLPASGAGPAPDRLVIGSEGILGVITEAWMRVFERPKFRSSASVRFARFDDGVTASRDLAQSGLYPTNCRLLDAREAMIHGVAADGSSVLLLGFEGDSPRVAWMDDALGRAAAAGGVADAPVHKAEGDRAHAADAGTWRQAFFDAPYRQSALLTVDVLADTFETACTWDRFAALHADVIAAVKRALGKPSVVSCRFTHVYPDGPAPYYTYVAPGATLERWRAAKEAASEVLSAHGATITHHHAVGRTHRKWYDRERPELFARGLAAVKRELDPTGMLNPGVLIG